MSLYDQLQKANSEEDVKDAYIKALGLKGHTKGLIDIQSKEIWFEAKHNGRESSYAMFTQLLHYVQVSLNKGETLPPFLAVIDTEKAALMKSADVLPFLAKKTIKWGKSATQYPQEALDAISAHIGTHFVSFKISTHEDEFISTVKAAIKSGDIIRTQITPANLKQVFDKWVVMVGREIDGVDEDDYALLFFADIMHDGTASTHENLPAALLHKDGKPVFALAGKMYALGSKEGYRQFWAIYHKPPKAEYRNYLLERRDSLIPLDERSFKGAYYTPLAVVDKAYDTLAATLGENWQKNYIVWDMCCGVGNLEVKHSNPRNIYMSTLDVADVDVMKATKTCVAAQRFQYDYLNDDITDDGKIDYNLTNKLPAGLRQAIAEGKKILVLINPPYAEATNGANTSIASRGDETSTKEGVAKTKVASNAMKEYGKASNELFTQFVARVAQEMPTATLAMFSKLKYVTAPTLEDFRRTWNAKYLGGFVVDSKSFDGLKGNFPIGFLIWKTDVNATKHTPIIEIQTEVLNKYAQPIGEKIFYSVPNKQLLSNWIKRTKANNLDVIPLKNSITPATATKDLRGTKWSDNGIGYFFSGGNDFQTSAKQTVIFSSGYSSARGFYINLENLWQVAIVFSVRRLAKATWLNDRDQFLQPTESLTDEFKTDCLMWMLFNGSNLTASANDLEWNNQTWSIVNHFIPFTEAEVNAPARFESDFMVQYLSNLPPLVIPVKTGIHVDLGVNITSTKNKLDSRFHGNDDSGYSGLSAEANAVLASGRLLWQAYFAHTDVRNVRDEFKLNRPDVGWYQIRNALKARNASGDFPPISFAEFEAAYKTLGDKLRPQVYELGFLR